MNEDIRPIRVMNIIARLNIGGPAIHVTMLTEKLGPPEYESVLVCGTITPGEGDMLYIAKQHQINPITIPDLGRELHPLRDLITLWKLYRLIREWKPDVVHTHTAKAGFVGRVAAWLAGVPVIVHTFHGHIFRGYYSPLKTRFFIELERMVARMSDTLITLTDTLRRELADEFRITRKGRITVLPLGLNLGEFAETPRKLGNCRETYNVPPDAPLVGIVGRMVPIKNHDLFLHAAVRAKAQLPKMHFLIVGDGETRPQVEAQVEELGLKDSVTFTGWVKELMPVYSDIDILVISSNNEGTPISVIEALSAGCAVVATQVGGVSDLLDQGELGELVPPNDAERMAQALVDVAQNPPDFRIAQQAMLDRYGSERLKYDMDSLYRGLLAKNKRAKS
jgi:glycosyltransferase involved in cell wall biosynthesis